MPTYQESQKQYYSTRAETLKKFATNKKNLVPVGKRYVRELQKKVNFKKNASGQTTNTSNIGKCVAKDSGRS